MTPVIAVNLVASTELISARHDALVGDLRSAGKDAAAAYEHLREFLISAFFDDASAKDVTALKRAYRADHFELGESEYNWALHNNLRLDTDASSLFTQAWAVEDSSSMWQDSMAVEGWALYAEALLAEPQQAAPHGFYSPEEHLYQLRGSLLRDLRVRIDTGIHTGRLTFDEAVDLFSETVDFLPGSCRDSASVKSESKQVSCSAAGRAVARYARWPTQAVTYRLGKEQILALRQRARNELGSNFSLKVFHLAFMTEGPIPAGYFAEELIESLKYEN